MSEKKEEISTPPSTSDSSTAPPNADKTETPPLPNCFEVPPKDNFETYKGIYQQFLDQLKNLSRAMHENPSSNTFKEVIFLCKSFELFTWNTSKNKSYENKKSQALRAADRCLYFYLFSWTDNTHDLKTKHSTTSLEIQAKTLKKDIHDTLNDFFTKYVSYEPPLPDIKPKDSGKNPPLDISKTKKTALSSKEEAVLQTVFKYYNAIEHSLNSLIEKLSDAKHVSAIQNEESNYMLEFINDLNKMKFFDLLGIADNNKLNINDRVQNLSNQIMPKLTSPKKGTFEDMCLEGIQLVFDTFIRLKKPELEIINDQLQKFLNIFDNIKQLPSGDSKENALFQNHQNLFMFIQLNVIPIYSREYKQFHHSTSDIDDIPTFFSAINQLPTYTYSIDELKKLIVPILDMIKASEQAIQKMAKIKVHTSKIVSPLASTSPQITKSPPSTTSPQTPSSPAKIASSSSSSSSTLNSSPLPPPADSSIIVSSSTTPSIASITPSTLPIHNAQIKLQFHTRDVKKTDDIKQKPYPTIEELRKIREAITHLNSQIFKPGLSFTKTQWEHNFLNLLAACYDAQIDVIEDIFEIFGPEKNENLYVLLDRRNLPLPENHWNEVKKVNPTNKVSKVTQSCFFELTTLCKEVGINMTAFATLEEMQTEFQRQKNAIEQFLNTEVQKSKPHAHYLKIKTLKKTFEDITDLQKALPDTLQKCKSSFDSISKPTTEAKRYPTLIQLRSIERERKNLDKNFSSITSSTDAHDARKKWQASFETFLSLCDKSGIDILTDATETFKDFVIFFTAFLKTSTFKNNTEQRSKSPETHILLFHCCNDLLSVIAINPPKINNYHEFLQAVKQIKTYFTDPTYEPRIQERNLFYILNLLTELNRSIPNTLSSGISALNHMVAHQSLNIPPKKYPDSSKLLLTSVPDFKIISTHAKRSPQEGKIYNNLLEAQNIWGIKFGFFLQACENIGFHIKPQATQILKDHPEILSYYFSESKNKVTPNYHIQELLHECCNDLLQLMNLPRIGIEVFENFDNFKSLYSQIQSAAVTHKKDLDSTSQSKLDEKETKADSPPKSAAAKLLAELEELEELEELGAQSKMAEKKKQKSEASPTFASLLNTADALAELYETIIATLNGSLEALETINRVFAKQNSHLEDDDTLYDTKIRAIPEKTIEATPITAEPQPFDQKYTIFYKTLFRISDKHQQLSNELNQREIDFIIEELKYVITQRHAQLVGFMCHYLENRLSQQKGGQAQLVAFKKELGEFASELLTRDPDHQIAQDILLAYGNYATQQPATLPTSPTTVTQTPKSPLATPKTPTTPQNLQPESLENNLGKRHTHRRYQRGSLSIKQAKNLSALLVQGENFLKTLREPSLHLPVTDAKYFLKACYNCKVFDNYPDFFRDDSYPIKKQDLDDILISINTALEKPSESFTENMLKAFELLKSIIQAYQEKEQLFTKPQMPKASSLSPSPYRSPSRSGTDKKLPKYDRLLQELKAATKKLPQECRNSLLRISQEYDLFEVTPLLTLPIQQQTATALQTASQRLSEAKITGSLQDDLLRHLAFNLYKLDKATSTPSYRQPDDIKAKTAKPMQQAKSFITLYDELLEKPARESIKESEFNEREKKLSSAWKNFLTSCQDAGLLTKTPLSFSQDDVAACLQQIKINIFSDPLYHTGNNTAQLEGFIQATEQVAERYLSLAEPGYKSHITSMRQFQSLQLQLTQSIAEISAMIGRIKNTENTEIKEKFTSTLADPTPHLQPCLTRCKQLGLIKFEKLPNPLTKEHLAAFESQLANIEYTKKPLELIIIRPTCEKAKELFRNYLLFLDLAKLPEPWRAVSIIENLDTLEETLKQLASLQRKGLEPTSSTTTVDVSEQAHAQYLLFKNFYSSTLLPLALSKGVMPLEESTRDIAFTLPKLLKNLARDSSFSLISEKLRCIKSLFEQLLPNTFNKSSFAEISATLKPGGGSSPGPLSPLRPNNHGPGSHSPAATNLNLLPSPVITSAGIPDTPPKTNTKTPKKDEQTAFTPK